MTCDIVRLTVSLKTGETISRVRIGETEIPDDKYMAGMALAMTGTELEALCDKLEQQTKANGHHNRDHRNGRREQTVGQASAGAGR